MRQVVVGPEVADALRRGRPVVALESSLIAHGLPYPHNLRAAFDSEAAVREAGATPATVAIDDGCLSIGASRELIERLAMPGSGAAKAASRDLAPLLAGRRLAATTVSATMRAAHLAGIRVLATGGIGGVHRGAAATFDVSSDIDELASTPVAVVCSGAKSILDLPATYELLETRRVPVIGLGADELPAFYTARSGLPLQHRVDSPEEAAAVAAQHFSIAGSAGILFVQPPPSDVAMDPRELEELLERAAEDVRAAGATGGAVTPAVLARVAELSAGRTLKVNIGLIIANAASAARLAGAHVRMAH